MLEKFQLIQFTNNDYIFFSTINRGRFFISKKILDKYSPISPMDKSCKLLNTHIGRTIDAQPGTAESVNNFI